MNVLDLNYGSERSLEEDGGFVFLLISTVYMLYWESGKIRDNTKGYEHEQHQNI